MKEDPKLTIAAAARNLDVNPVTLSLALNQRKQDIADDKIKSKSHGGQNRIPIKAQEEPMRQFVRSMFYKGWGATQTMVQNSIIALCKKGNKPKPSARWFASSFKKQQEHFKTITTKLIKKARITAQDEKIVNA